MVQPQAKESLEAHIPFNGGQSKDELSPTHRSDLGPDVEPMVAIRNGWVIPKEGARVGLASAPPNLTSTDPV